MENKEYYFIDIDINTMKLVKWGVSTTATLTGNTSIRHIHRIFLTKGQYNKFLEKI